MANFTHAGKSTFSHWVTIAVSVFGIDFGIRHLSHGSGEVYLHDHLWLLLVPVAVIFLILFGWSYCQQYKS